ncbi:MAG: protein kinase domain-containing protein [Granulosicoccaceae bacterium]
MAPVARPADNEIACPNQIDHYHIEGVLGKGTCGTVYRAWDAREERAVAIKISERLTPEQLGMGDEEPIKRKPAHYRAFLTEVAAATRLQHPGIVKLYNVGTTQTLNYLVLELVEGTTLKSHGKGQELLPVRQVLEIIIQCCETLDYLHGQGFIHRDVKPSNIMLTPDGRAKLLDFGIAVPMEQVSEAGRKASLGTPNYMSPEQIQGQPLGPATDLYSLGTVMFEMLTGKRLFNARKVKELFSIVMRRPAPQLHSHMPHLPMSLNAILVKALKKKPENRFQSGREMAAALREVIDELVHGGHKKPGEMLQVLSQHSFFQNFSEFELAELLRGSKLVKFERGDKLVASGEVAGALYLVADGLARVESESGESLQLLGDGDYVGETGFVSDMPSPDSVVAITEVFAYRVRDGFFDSAPVTVQTAIYRAFAQVLARRVCDEAGLRLDIEV